MNTTVAKTLFEKGTAHLEGRLLEANGWTVHERSFPVLDVSFTDAGRQPLRVRLMCDDWNDTPPAVLLLSPAGDPLTALPSQRGDTIFNGGGHPTTGRPFVCMAGTREYHTHPSHIGELWTNYKNEESFSLGGLLTKLWHGWRRTWP